MQQIRSANNEEDTVDRSIYDLFHDDERNTHRYIWQNQNLGVDIIPSNISRLQ